MAEFSREKMMLRCGNFVSSPGVTGALNKNAKPKIKIQRKGAKNAKVRKEKLEMIDSAR